MSESRRTISFTVESEKDKEYLESIAQEKGYGRVSVMARVALLQFLGRMKIQYPCPGAFTVCENPSQGNSEEG